MTEHDNADDYTETPDQSAALADQNLRAMGSAGLVPDPRWPTPTFNAAAAVLPPGARASGGAGSAPTFSTPPLDPNAPHVEPWGGGNGGQLVARSSTRDYSNAPNFGQRIASAAFEATRRTIADALAPWFGNGQPPIDAAVDAVMRALAQYQPDTTVEVTGATTRRAALPAHTTRTGAEIYDNQIGLLPPLRGDEHLALITALGQVSRAEPVSEGAATTVVKTLARLAGIDMSAADLHNQIRPIPVGPIDDVFPAGDTTTAFLSGRPDQP